MTTSKKGCDECRLGDAVPVEAVVQRRAVLQLGAAGTAALLAACGSNAHEMPTGGGVGSDGGGVDPDGGGSDPQAGGSQPADDGGCSAGGRSFALSFSQYPQLMQVGGSVTVAASGYSDSCRRNLVIVAKVSADTFVALSASCTHQCCPVSYAGGSFRCPCHGSTFDMGGAVMRGPAGRPLQKLEVCSDDSGVNVTLA